MLFLLKMGDWGTDVPENFSNQMCEIATTAGTPEVSMKDLLLKAARAIADNVMAVIAKVKHLTISLGHIAKNGI